MVLDEEEVEKKNKVWFSTNISPVFRLVSFREGYIRNSKILKLFFLSYSFAPSTWKTFVYLHGCLYFSLGTIYHHHLLSPGISQYYPSWNLGIYFPTHLLVPNIMLISARGIFYKLKSCPFLLITFRWIAMVLGIKKQNFTIAYWPCKTQTLLDPTGWDDHKVTMEEPSWPTVSFLLP